MSALSGLLTLSPRARCVQLFASDADQATLHTRLDALQAAWELQHAPGAKTVSFGVWPPGSAVGEVTLKRGKGWQAFGQHTGARTLLSPEETLFLMESDRLVCFPALGAKAPLTLHAGYAAAAAAGVTPERYAAFAHLCRMGFVVRRCNTPWFLDRHGWAHAAQEEALLQQQEAAGAAGGSAAAPPEPEAVAGGAGESELGDDAGWAAQQEQAGDDAPAAPPQEAPPPEQQPADAPAASPLPAPGASEGGCRGWWPASAWGEAAEPVAAQPAAAPPPPPARPVPAPAATTPSGWRPELVYDVWPPRATFNKRHAGPPSFRLCLASVRPPTCAELAALTAASGRVPVKCVIVRPGMFIGFDVGLSCAEQ
jgi:tRNA-splicing endonuclease subunit Sen54